MRSFIGLLENKKKLLRNYSQNVDGLERKAGIKNVLECHGTMSMFYCTGAKCKKKKSLEEVTPEIKQGQVLNCDKCGEVLKPGITFFGEHVPKAFDRCIAKDVDKADLVIVIGTSLKVGGSVYNLIQHMPPGVPQILINKEQVTLPKTLSGGFDVSLLGNCDEVTSYLCERLGWSEDMQTLAVGEGTVSAGGKRDRPDGEAEAEDGRGGKVAKLDGGKAVKKKKKVLPPIVPSTSFQCKEEAARVFTISPNEV